MIKRFYTVIELLVVMAILLIGGGIVIGIIIWGCMFFFGAKAIQEVNENGAKSTVERIWEGPDKSDSTVQPTEAE